MAKANQCFVLHFALLSSCSMWVHGVSRSVRTLIDADHSECLVMKITVALGLGKTLLGFRICLDCPRPVYHCTALNVPVHLRLSQTHVNAVMV